MLHVDLSMGQWTRFGSALLNFWYSNTCDQFKGLLFSMSGYPHHGGSHALVISAYPRDVLAWLDLFEEKYPFVKEELDILREEIQSRALGNGRIWMHRILDEKAPQYNWQWRKCDNKFFSPEREQPDYNDVVLAVEAKKAKRKELRKAIAEQNPAQPFIGRPVIKQEPVDEDLEVMRAPFTKGFSGYHPVEEDYALVKGKVDGKD